ncbi:TetR/AcrR family transcriptional regulator [Anaerostipes sp.]|uniref:TetR/AcrR family transcriptional regulator n=1 Tax=Anaerostipes sp. TaxID=1872530 RepID=UPI0025C64A09|nr:TetR/AcrR family transcriptional regulator [Anaerostipes sp.]MBS7007619.1 TetR/AcrR family transcriptional regulator [Anaerostipes sp.]
MKDKFYQLPRDKRERMIEAGYRVFAKNEYKRASMSAIADAAGISKSLLFYYFTNKKELYLFLVSNALYLTQKTARQYRVSETKDFFEMLCRNLKAKCSLSVKYPYISAFSLKAYYEQNPEVKKDVCRLIDKQNQIGRHEFLESMDGSLFREDIDLEMMFQEITLACEGYLYHTYHEGWIDFGQVEKDFGDLITHWKNIYLKR